MADGTIYNFDMFRKSRVLFHEFKGILPRGITPTDIDMTFEINGYFFYGEYKSNSPYWEAVPTGQQLYYQRLVKLGAGQIVAACIQHRSSGEFINAISDILQFQLMTYRDGRLRFSEVYDGSRFKAFLKAFATVATGESE